MSFISITDWISCDYDDSGDEDEKAKQDEQMVRTFLFVLPMNVTLI